MNAQFKANGDTENHYDSATIAVARKYYQICFNMTRDDAKEKVAQLIEAGNLKTSTFYNEAIARFKKDESIREESNARKQERAEQFRKEREAKEKTKQEHYERKAQADSSEYVLGDIQKEQLKMFISLGLGKATIVDYLKRVCKFNKAQIEKCIKDLMPTPEKRSRISFDDRFCEFLFERVRSEDEVIAFLQAEDAITGNNNKMKHLRGFQAYAKGCNAIHEKYKT